MNTIVFVIDLTATSKGRPSGVWQRVLPSWMARWFTWPRTTVGRLLRTQAFPIPVTLPDVPIRLSLAVSQADVEASLTTAVASVSAEVT